MQREVEEKYEIGIRMGGTWNHVQREKELQ